MFQFIFCAIISSLFAYISYRNNDRKWLIASFGVIVYIMAFQDDISVDFPSYKETFTGICNGSVRPSLFFSQREYGSEIEPGWWFLNKFFTFITDSYYIVSFLCCSFICSALYKLCIRIPSKYYWLAVLYFYFSPMLFYMSGVRQGVAVAMFVYLCLCLLEKKYLMAVVWFFLGLSIHNSMAFSIVFIPLLFLNKVDNKKIINIICLCLVAFFCAAFMFAQQIQNSLLVKPSMLFEGNDLYVRYLDEIQVATFSLNNILNKSFIFAFTILAFYKSKGFTTFIISCFVVAQLYDVLLGYEGSIGRVFLFIKIFATPVVAYIPFAIKPKVLRIVFIIGLLFLVMWQFWGMLNNEQYMRFLDYKTILF